MKELLNQILDGQKQITQRLDKIDDRLDRLEENQVQITQRFDRLESDMASERQLIEVSQIVHALKHNSEEANAQLHSIGHNLNVLTGKAATKEDVADLSAQFRVLNERLFRQEVEVDKLKAVK